MEDQGRAWLQGKLSEVASVAFHSAPVSKPTPIHPRSSAPQVVPGQLKHSINTRIDGSYPELVGKVIANVPYAYFVHEGTQAHPILPRRPAYALAFWWERQGEFVTRNSVFHPGTTAQPFLRDALESVMRS